MKIIIFAGGAGTRMWPLSRKSFPKQFIKMFKGKSTLELAINRVKSFGYENIFVSTVKEYVTLTKKYLPKIPARNIIGEPALRNLAPAVGLNLINLRAKGYKGPVAILWADHLIENETLFLETIKKAEEISLKNPDKIIFVGKTPRFANNNLGWIHFGKKTSKDIFEYNKWFYKPPVEECEKMFKSKEWLWNTGYFFMDIDFGCYLYEKYQPEIYKKLLLIEKSLGKGKEKEIINKVYPAMERISFDDAIAKNVLPSEALVLKTEMEWSDPGTLYALKEALTENEKDNLIMGNVKTQNTADSLLVNHEKKKLLATIGLKGVAVVNTKDVVLVVPKEDVKEISDLLTEIEKDKNLKKYL